MCFRSHRLSVRSPQLLAVLLFALALFVGATASAQATTARPSARICSLSAVGEKLGPTYVETLKVIHTTCGAGEMLITNYNACRLASGGAKGKCTVRVDGFKCREKRSVGPVQFEAAVTCTRARQAVDFAYSENT
jgi:hypothetical protein